MSRQNKDVNGCAHRSWHQSARGQCIHSLVMKVTILASHDFLSVHLKFINYASNYFIPEACPDKIQNISATFGAGGVLFDATQSCLWSASHFYFQ